jgi:hypothetical protein
MRALLVVVLLAGAASAQTEPKTEKPPDPPKVEAEEDDPGFARKKPVTPVIDEGEEPTPDPRPYTDEDPGFEPPGSGDTVVKRPVKKPPRPLGPIAMTLRGSYSLFWLPDTVSYDEISKMATTDNSTFHALGIDAYPISLAGRVGLSLRFALDPSKSDWLATVGLNVGGQKRGMKATWWGQAGMHVGTGMRNYYYPQDQLPPVIESGLTLVWVFDLQAGVDVRLAGRAVGTAALGVQNASYFTSYGDIQDSVVTVSGTSLLLTLGIGY